MPAVLPHTQIHSFTAIIPVSQPSCPSIDAGSRLELPPTATTACYLVLLLLYGCACGIMQVLIFQSVAALTAQPRSHRLQY